MIQAGVALPEAMTVTSESVSNSVYKRGLDTIRDEMLEGRGLADPVATTQLFPSAARQMMRVGEETGTLDEQLTVAAQYYARGARFQDQAFYGPVRAGDHHCHGRRRRLRRDRPHLGNVRHLSAGEGHVAPLRLHLHALQPSPTSMVLRVRGQRNSVSSLRLDRYPATSFSYNEPASKSPRQNRRNQRPTIRRTGSIVPAGSTSAQAKCTNGARMRSQRLTHVDYSAWVTWIEIRHLQDDESYPSPVTR